MVEPMKCSKCGRTKFEDSLASLIEKGISPAKFADYCFDCGMQELKTRLKGVPFTIEVPDFSKDTNKGLMEKSTAINYTAELVNY